MITEPESRLSPLLQGRRQPELTFVPLPQSKPEAILLAGASPSDPGDPDWGHVACWWGFECGQTVRSGLHPTPYHSQGDKQQASTFVALFDCGLHYLLTLVNKDI